MWAMPSVAPINASARSNPMRNVTSHFAAIGSGRGKMSTASLGQYQAKATATPRTAPDAPMICDTGTSCRKMNDCGSPDTAEEIKQQEQATTHPVLDRRAEDEQHQHVEQDVRNTCVQEHVGDERPRILPGTRGGKPERAGKARGCQQRALNEKYEQVGDE